MTCTERASSCWLIFSYPKAPRDNISGYFLSPNWGFASPLGNDLDSELCSCVSHAWSIKSECVHCLEVEIKA
ncbi:hypothetical protein OUZ56_021260 [Daphnia magna]|uniref:Uncharacterized protein n=1 Tax=Daphnia magna TaxID=35525 RepID=A0ABQ9ZGX2_9CRUS|nr:hypothetical protein OUZ56_021260 [Daphnia magna]